MSNEFECAFCTKKTENDLLEDNLFSAFRDKRPVSRGHTLIVPKRHVENFFEMAPEEGSHLFGFIVTVKNFLQSQYSPSGFNVGVNVGAAAGQTVFHAHIHVVPRYLGDVTDPRGGIRNVIH